MAFHHDVSRCLASFIARMRGRAGDDVCLARIEHYLEQRGGNDSTRWTAGSGGGAEDARIKAAVATMPPLTRAILVLVVRNRMSVAEVSRRFGMSEDRVCRHYRLAVAIVLKHRKGEEP